MFTPHQCSGPQFPQTTDIVFSPCLLCLWDSVPTRTSICPLLFKGGKQQRISYRVVDFLKSFLLLLGNRLQDFLTPVALARSSGKKIAKLSPCKPPDTGYILSHTGVPSRASPSQLHAEPHVPSFSVKQRRGHVCLSLLATALRCAPASCWRKQCLGNTGPVVMCL